MGNTNPFSKKKVIVKLRKEINLPYERNADVHLANSNFSPAWFDLVQKFPGLQLHPVFTALSVQQMASLVAKASGKDASYKPVDFSNYYFSYVPANFTRQSLDMLMKSKLFDHADLQTEVLVPDEVDPTNDPLYNRQGYLQPAPDGIHAAAAWGVSGGDGEAPPGVEKVRFVDIECGWNFVHEDLDTTAGSLLYGQSRAFNEHGTNVFGVVGAKDNDKGIVGIVPKCRLTAVSVFDDAGDDIPANAIIFAVSNLSYGDVILLELQTDDKLPIEELYVNHDVIRLGTALGIVIVEAAGNGNYNLDNYQNYDRKFIFNINDPSFRDSGAIMVGGVDSAPRLNSRNELVAGSRTAAVLHGDGSNFGSRVNCFARYNNITTTGPSNYDLSNGIPPGTYTHTFNGTSGASAIIAGLTLSVQSMLQFLPSGRYNSWQMRKLLSDHNLGTESVNMDIDKVNVMPDLQKIVDHLQNNDYVDVYVRDNLDDTGDRYAGAISVSPDVITINGPVADRIVRDGNHQAVFGEGSANENSNNLSNTVRQDIDNYIFVRVKNRGTRDANNVKIRVYYADVATLITPYEWKLVGETTIANVPADNTLIVSNPMTWNAASVNPVPGSGHYCYVCIIGNDDDPMPLLLSEHDDERDDSGDTGTELIDYSWDEFTRLIRDNNNITWRNFNVVDIDLSASSSVQVAFMLRGAPDEERKYDLVIVHDLPKNTYVQLVFPSHASDIFNRNKQIYNTGEESFIEGINANAYEIEHVILSKGYKTPFKIRVTLPEETEFRELHHFSIQQLYRNHIVGQITWQLRIKPK